MHRSNVSAEGGSYEEPPAVVLDDPAAFRGLYERYAGTVFRYARARLRNQEAAEDVTSEVFLKAWRGRDGYRGGSAGAWLIVIARHAVADATRRRRLATTPIEDAASAADPARLPDDAAIAAAEREALLGAVAQLTEEQRTVVELQLAGWTGSEIAEGLGRTNAAVKMLRYRAVQRLRVLLDAAPRETSHD